MTRTPSRFTALTPTNRDLIHLLTPRCFANTLFEVTPERLQSLGIDGVMLDMDNTLTEHHAIDFTPAVVDWLASVHDAGIKTCVVSNTHRISRLKRLCEARGIDYVRGVRKPRRNGFRRALEKMGTLPERTAMIGDQIFTDVLGGNRLGLYTILVQPLSREEFLGTRWISRNLERLLFRYLERNRRSPRRLNEIPDSPNLSPDSDGSEG